MASSVTTIAATKVLETTEAITLYGPTKFVIENPGADDVVYIYEETATEGTYQKVRSGNRAYAVLGHDQPSFPFEGYGSYKLLLGEGTDESLVVGYVA